MEKIQNFDNNKKDKIIIELAQEVINQQIKLEKILNQEKLKKNLKKTEHEDSEQENSEENSQSPELQNNSNNLSDSQRTITQSQVNYDMEIKNIYKTLFIFALVLCIISILVAWYFYMSRNFYIKLIERENVNIERESVIIETIVEGFKKLKRNKIEF
ncbi:8363_t:CDS:2 [Scutellospora calospora]|uniref:8363_t:CDS:1 n=1 Tax=Scutellospora calospora TaxID=85575 RepID=A0ACA9JZ41_9GLOM|nr:8363_t:CDS:2 [Scutellospora calospora]